MIKTLFPSLSVFGLLNDGHIYEFKAVITTLQPILFEKT